MKSHTLLALTASALALPGVHEAAKADAAPTDSTLAYRISSYAEDALDAARTAGGSTERYDIDVHQLQYRTPLGERHGLSLTSSYESMSGASPWYLIQRPGGETAVVMSGATISEQRRDLGATLRRYLDNGTVGLSLAGSHENDYDSVSGGLDAERHFNDNLTTVAGGFSLASDELSPTDAHLFNRVETAQKRSRSAFVSLTQVLDRNSVLQSGLSVTYLGGFLSDPYKLGDFRPDTRTQVAWTTAWRRYVAPAAAALHVDYRFYHDNFGIDSHTLDLAWYQNLGARVQLVPGLRYYSQNAADFFRPAIDFSASVPLQSTDYRLSSYGAIAGSLKLQVAWDGVILSLSAERYRASEAWGAWDGAASPALVSFTRLSAGLEYRY